MAVVSFILAGLFLVVVLGFLKLTHDMRIHALHEADQAFDEHFSQLDRFIKDPAAPLSLSEFALQISVTSQSPKFGKFATRHISEINDTNVDRSNENVNKTIKELEELNTHRPDLVEAFNKAMRSAFFGAVYRHVADELSPIQAYKEAKAAKAAKTSRKSEKAPGPIFSADVFDWCKAA